MVSIDDAGELAARRWSRGQIEAALGEPLMVPDPLLTAAQAATLLDVCQGQLQGLSQAAGIRPACAAVGNATDYPTSSRLTPNSRRRRGRE
jgi:hypothetical protein